MSIRVALNGTATNLYHALGLTQNPFPQIPKHEISGHLLHLAALGGDPIPDTAFIRSHLKGWSDEFVDLCCERFEPGKYVEFEVTWP